MMQGYGSIRYIQSFSIISLLVRNGYSLVKSHTVVVSCKEALEKIKEAKTQGKDIAELVETEFTGENLEDFKKLKEMILEKVKVSEESIKKRLDRFEYLVNKVKKDIDEKYPSDEIGVLTEKIKHSPNDPEFFSKRSHCFYKNGDYKSAVDDITRAIQLGLSDAKYYHRRSSIYFNTQEYDRALNDVEKAIKLDPNVAAYYNTIAAVFKAQKKYNKALQNYNKAIQMDPENGTYIANRDRLYRVIDERIAKIVQDVKLTLSGADKKALRKMAVDCGFSKREVIKKAEKAIKEKAKKDGRLFLWGFLKGLKIVGNVILVLVFLVLLFFILYIYLKAGNELSAAPVSKLAYVLKHSLTSTFFILNFLTRLFQNSLMF